MVSLKTEGTTDEIYSERVEDSDSLMTVREVARRLNVHINTVRKWSNLGVLKGFRVGPRGDRRFLKEDVDKFIQK
jgi:excisionase family DNA binding protein